MLCSFLSILYIVLVFLLLIGTLTLAVQLSLDSLQSLCRLIRR